MLQRLQVPLRRDAAQDHRPRATSAAAGPHAVSQGHGGEKLEKSVGGNHGKLTVFIGLHGKCQGITGHPLEYGFE